MANGRRKSEVFAVANRIFPDSDYDSELKKRLIAVASDLFATHNYSAVSVREIANKAGVRQSAIYYHFEGKEALLNEVLYRFERKYKHFLSAMSERIDNLVFKEVLPDVVFYNYFVEFTDPITRLGLSLVLKEHNNNEYAQELFYDLIIDQSVKQLFSAYSRFFGKGQCNAPKTKALATLSVFHALIINEMQIKDYTGVCKPQEYTEISDSMSRIFNATLKTPPACT